MQVRILLFLNPFFFLSLLCCCRSDLVFFCSVIFFSLLFLSVFAVSFFCFFVSSFSCFSFLFQRVAKLWKTFWEERITKKENNFHFLLFSAQKDEKRFTKKNQFFIFSFSICRVYSTDYYYNTPFFYEPWYHPVYWWPWYTYPLYGGCGWGGWGVINRKTKTENIDKKQKKRGGKTDNRMPRKRKKAEN